MSDTAGRLCLGDYVPAGPRLFHVGRLDAASEGLLLLTNDGALAHRLTHPSYGVAKTYLVEVRVPLAAGLGRRLRAGVDLEDGPMRVDAFRVVATSGRRVSVEVVVHEGRKRVIRRLFATAGHPVERLVRTRIGPLRLNGLAPGGMRALSGVEVHALGSVVRRAPTSEPRNSFIDKRMKR
jgi:pseudouridine synthase